MAKAIQKYTKTASKLADWLEAIAEGLSVFAFPEAHRHLICTTNGVERLNKDLQRRTHVVDIFPNEASCLQPVSAILMEINDKWKTGKRLLTFAST